jgi:hypothetical protein
VKHPTLLACRDESIDADAFLRAVLHHATNAGLRVEARDASPRHPFYAICSPGSFDDKVTVRIWTEDRRRWAGYAWFGHNDPCASALTRDEFIGILIAWTAVAQDMRRYGVKPS